MSVWVMLVFPSKMARDEDEEKRVADTRKVSRDRWPGKRNECNHKENHGDITKQDMSVDANHKVPM
jgi:hypothetical protein